MISVLRGILPVASKIFLGLAVLFFLVSRFQSKRRGQRRLYMQGVFLFLLCAFLSFTYPVAVGFLDGYFLS